MTKYVVREKWPRCKKWDIVRTFDTFEKANDLFQAMTKVEPDDGYKISGAPKGKIVIQILKVEILKEGMI